MYIQGVLVWVLRRGRDVISRAPQEEEEKEEESEEEEEDEEEEEFM